MPWLRTIHFLFLADCEWSDFSVWSPCSKSCGNGIQSRSRYIQRPAVSGGRNCTGEPSETRNCAKNSCPGNHYF